MAADLAATPVTGLRVQLCGDAHLSNFGVFASPERQLVFDLNDFDETLPGPWEWDVKRLAASFAVAGRDRGFGAERRSDVVRARSARLPRGDARASPSMRTLDVWYARIDVERWSTAGRRRSSRDRASASTRRWPRPGARTACARSRSSPTIVDGEPRIVSDPPLIVPVDELAAPSDAAP